MQQHGSPKCLLIDNGDDEFELDPFPAAVACSPSAGAAHGGAGGNPAGTSFHQHYAGFELLEVSGIFWHQGFVHNASSITDGC